MATCMIWHFNYKITNRLYTRTQMATCMIWHFNYIRIVTFISVYCTYRYINVFLICWLDNIARRINCIFIQQNVDANI